MGAKIKGVKGQLKNFIQGFIGKSIKEGITVDKRLKADKLADFATKLSIDRKIIILNLGSKVTINSKKYFDDKINNDDVIN